MGLSVTYDWSRLPSGARKNHERNLRRRFDEYFACFDVDMKITCVPQSLRRGGDRAMCIKLDDTDAFAVKSGALPVMMRTIGAQVVHVWLRSDSDPDSLRAIITAGPYDGISLRKRARALAAPT